jgi:hypothetical protein
MLIYIPKVTIYKIGTLKPNAPNVVELMLKFSNPNMTRAQIKFRSLETIELQEVDPHGKIQCDMDYPLEEILVDQ